MKFGVWINKVLWLFASAFVSMVLQELSASFNWFESSIMEFILKYLFEITVFSVLTYFLISLSIKAEKQKKEEKKELKENEIKEMKKLNYKREFESNTLEKYNAFKRSFEGMTSFTPNGTVPTELIQFPQNFTEKEIELLTEKGLIRWEISALL